MKRLQPSEPANTPKLILKLFGGFSAALSNGKEVSVTSRKDQALLAFLALERGQRHGRSKLAALLWSDHDEASARHSLRQALSDLRRLGVDEEILAADRNVLYTRDDLIVADAHEFARLCKIGTTDSLERAVELYSGDLLEDIGLSEETFETWLVGARDALRQQLSGAYSNLIRAYTSQGKLHKAIECTRNLLEVDPYNETMIRERMDLLVRANRGLEALRDYQEFSSLLAKELSVSPEARTTELYIKIADDRVANQKVGSNSAQSLAQVTLLEAFRSLDGFVVWDEADRFVACNDKFRQIFLPAEHLLTPGTSWEEIMRACIQAGRFPQALADPENYLRARAERRRIGKAEAPDTELDDGRCYRLTHRRTEAGGLIVIFTDSSDRTKREMALKRSHFRLQALIAAVPLGIEEVEANGCIAFCNQSFANMLGYEATELIGRRQSEIMSAPWIAKALTVTKRGRMAIREAVVEYITRLGEPMPAHVRWQGIKNEQGVSIGFMGVVVALRKV
jgi:PAS domain S-box-containing protein